MTAASSASGPPGQPGRPRASVVMTVYGDLRFLDEAVDSILQQDFADLELVVVDDGAGQDVVFEALARRDPRIRIVTNPTNLGTAAAANRGIAAARADIIVRLDADDVSEPSRVGRLVAALDDDPDLGLVGSWCTWIDEAGRPHGLQRMPESDLDIRWTILFHNPFYHSTVAFRRRCFEAAGRYRVDELVSQDHYLWFDMVPLCRARNIPASLVRYRLNPRGLTAMNATRPRNRTHPIREALWSRLGLAYDLHDDARAHDVTQFLRGFAIAAPDRRAAAYHVITTVLPAFLRAARPFVRAEDAAAARRLVRVLVTRMLASPPADRRERGLLRRACWSLDRRATALATAERLGKDLEAGVRAMRDRVLGRPRVAASDGTAAVGDARPLQPPAVPNGPPELDPAAWFAGKSLSTDWTSPCFQVWAALLAARRHEPLEVLEVGSWEGRSAIFFLRCLSRCRIVCIDTFTGSPEHVLHPKWAEALPHIEDRFDANLAEFGDRVEKIKDTSVRALARLASEGRRFDLVYIDGSHASADVQADIVLSWPMVRDGGIVIFDDYEWTFFPDAADRPKLGVDTFLAVRPGCYRELHRGYQLIVEKTAPPPG